MNSENNSTNILPKPSKDEEEQQFIEYYETKNLDPFEKYQKKNVFPKRLILQVLLVIFTTLQVKYYGIYQKDYRRFNINMWEDLLLEIDDEEQVQQEFYTVSAVSENLHNTVAFFQEINDNVIFTVLEPENTKYYLFSYYENLKQNDVMKSLKVEIDIDEGIKRPFDYNNLDELKEYLIGVQRFTFYVHNLHSKFPVLGHICWDIQIHYKVESDFIVFASIDATQIKCPATYNDNDANEDEDIDGDGEITQQITSRRILLSDEFEVLEFEQHSQQINKKIQDRILELQDHNNQYTPKSVKTEKRVLKEEQIKKQLKQHQKSKKKSKNNNKNSKSITSIKKQNQSIKSLQIDFNNDLKGNQNQNYEHYFNSLSPKAQHQLLQEYHNLQNLSTKQINYDKQFINKRILQIVELDEISTINSENGISTSSYQGQTDLIMLNIIVILLALVVFIFHFNRIYKGVKNYLGLREVRKHKVMEALQKVKLHLKKNDEKASSTKTSKFEEVVESLTTKQQQSQQFSINQDEDNQPEKIESSLNQKEKNQKEEKFDEIQMQEINQKEEKKDNENENENEKKRQINLPDFQSEASSDNQIFQQQQRQQQQVNKKIHEEVKYLGQVHFENKNSIYPFISFWVIFNSYGNFIQIMCSISLSFNQISNTLSDSNSESDDTFRELLLGLGCAFAWISLSEFLETLRDRRHDIFSYLMKNLLKAWFYNLVTIFPVFMAYTIIGTAFYWKSDFFENLTTSAITLFSIYHGDMVSDFMYSVSDITQSPLHSLYIISFTMLFAMFVYNMFTSVIGETREQLIKQRDEERKYKKMKEKQMRKLKKQQKLKELKAQQSIVTIQEDNESDEEDSSDDDQNENQYKNQKIRKLQTESEQSKDLNDEMKISRMESIIRDKKEVQKIKREESQKQKEKIQVYQEEEEVYDKLCDNLETKQITMEILLKEFDQIQHLMEHLNLKKEDKQKMYLRIIKYLEGFQGQVEQEIKESGNILLEQEQLIKNQKIIDE